MGCASEEAFLLARMLEEREIDLLTSVKASCNQDCVLAGSPANTARGGCGGVFFYSKMFVYYEPQFSGEVEKSEGFVRVEMDVCRQVLGLGGGSRLS
jgi:hypothetical protein